MGAYIVTKDHVAVSSMAMAPGYVHYSILVMLAFYLTFDFDTGSKTTVAPFTNMV